MSSDDLQKQWASAYLSGGSMDYVDNLYEDYLASPHSVSADWRHVFEQLETGHGQARDVSHREVVHYFLNQKNSKQSVLQASEDSKQYRVAKLINEYRSQGHHAAKLDPLDMAKRVSVPSLELEYHHLSESDLNHVYFAGKYFNEGRIPLSEIYQALRETYCGSIGI